MALRDTSWVWDTTADAPKTANAITTQQTGGIEKQSIGDTTVYRRVSNTTYEWVSVTKAAALAFVKNISDDTNNTDKTPTMTEANRIVGAYNVTMVVNTTGGWL